jgi:hypothetical protein
MARHKATHINIGYAPNAEIADKALTVNAAIMHEMGLLIILDGI